MSRIAIIGSCVTRDVWHLLKIPTGNLRTISRTSLASITAPVPANFVLPPDMGALDPDGFLARCVRADVSKTALVELEAFRPEVLIFDFIDERFDLLRIGDSIVCDSFEFRRSGLRGREPFIDGRLVRRLSSEAETAWLAGLAQLRARIAAGPLAAARVVLHHALWAEEYLEGSGRKRFPDLARFHPVPRVPEPVVKHNEMLARYHAAFLAAFPHALSIAPGGTHRVGDAAHPWGLSPHHYGPGYYAEFRDQALALGLTLS
jgi:hypothetical protein